MTPADKKEIDHINFIFSDAEFKKHCETVAACSNSEPAEIEIEKKDDDQLNND